MEDTEGVIPSPLTPLVEEQKGRNGLTAPAAEGDLVDTARFLTNTDLEINAYLKSLGLSETQISRIQTLKNQLKDKEGITDIGRVQMVNAALRLALKRLGIENMVPDQEFSSLVSNAQILLIEQGMEGFGEIGRMIQENIVNLQRVGVKMLLLPVTQETLKYLRDKGREGHLEMYQRRIRDGAIKTEDPDLPAIEGLIDIIDSVVDPQTGEPVVKIGPLVSNPNAPGDDVGGRPSVWKNTPTKERQYPPEQIIGNYRKFGRVVAVMKEVPSYFNFKKAKSIEVESIKPEDVRVGLQRKLKEENLEVNLRSARVAPDGTLTEIIPVGATPPQESSQRAA